MRRKKEPEGWPPDKLAAAWALVDDPDVKECQHCNGYHTRACPRVRRISFYPPDADGAIGVKEVEFWAWSDWPHETVVFADLLPYPEDRNDDTDNGN